MAKIENITVYPTVVPSAEDLLIATDVSDNNKTVTFKVSSILGTSTLQGLQSVLDVNNSAIQNMTLTGNATIIGSVIPNSITAGGSTGLVGQVLTSTGSGIQWSSVSNTQTLQQTLDNGNSATGVNMDIDSGVINVTNGGVVLDNLSYLTVGGVSTFNSDVNLSTTLNLGATTTINDYSGSVGTPGQVLTVNSAGTGVEWSSVAGTTPSLQQVLNVGNTATNIGINMDGNGAFTTSSTNTMTLASVNTFSGTNTFTADIEVDGTIEDGTGSAGTAGQVLSSTGTGVQWVDAASATDPTLQSVLTAGNTATEDINLTGDIDLTGQLKFQASSTIFAGGGIGTNGQVLTSTGGGVTWSDVSVNPTLNDVLTNGNTSALNLTLTGSGVVTAPTVAPTNIEDSTGSTGTAGFVLTSTATGVQWQSVSGASVSSVTAAASGTSTGNPLTITPSTGAVTVASNAFAGGSNVGHVPSGGLVGQYLDGTGAWVNIPSGGGSMSSFDITDGTTSQTITDGNTITFSVGTPAFSAGTGLSATVSATDTLTLVNTGITNITAGSDIGVSISATGEATISYTGTAGMTSWNIGDNSTTSAITNGDTVNIIGGTGITSTLSGDDITLSTAAVLTESVATSTSTGLPLTASITTNNLQLTSHAYMGGSNVGYVPTGGTAGTVLAGDGTWVANSSGMASFGIAGDTGSDTVNITDNTLSVLGSAPISTAVSATNNVTVSHDTSGVVANSYAYPSAVTVDSYGHITNITAGSAPGTMSLWKLAAGATGVYSDVEDSDYVTFNAIGSGISCSLSGSGTFASPYVVGIENDGVVAVTGGSGISTSAASGSITLTNDGVLSVDTSNGTYIDLTPAASTTGAVTVTADLSAANGAAPSGLFLSKDNTWATPSLSGSVVTSVNNTDGNLTIAGTGAGPFTGDLVINYNGPTGTMSNWILGSDDGAPYETITDAELVSILGGTGITTSNIGSALTIENDGVLSLAVSGSGISVDQNTGDITISNTGVTSLTAGAGISLDASTGAVQISATGGGGAMTSWNLTGDAGGTDTITDGQNVSIVGGTNISTSLNTATNTLTINSTSTISGTQDFISKFTSASAIGNSRIYDTGSDSVNIDGTTVRSGYTLSLGNNSSIYVENTKNTFAVTDVSGNLPAGGFGEDNVLISPGGLSNATLSATQYVRNTIIGSNSATGFTDESDVVVIGSNTANGTLGVRNGDVIIGSRAALNLSLGGVGTSSNVIIGYEAATSGSLKAGVVVVGYQAATGGVQDDCVIIGSISMPTAEGQGNTVVGSRTGTNWSSSNAASCTLIGSNINSFGSTQTFTLSNATALGANAIAAHDNVLVLGNAAESFGPNTISIGSSTVPLAPVTTQVNTSTRYLPVYINGTLHKVLLA